MCIYIYSDGGGAMSLLTQSQTLILMPESIWTPQFVDLCHRKGNLDRWGRALVVHLTEIRQQNVIF